MKIVCISDTHDNHKKINIPECDVLVVAGDFTSHLDPIVDNYKDFDAWLGEQPAHHKIVVAGNHDTLLDRLGSTLPGKIYITNGIYLQDEAVCIDGVKFYGSPWTPKFGPWAFMKNDADLHVFWDKIPADTDVLITHGPAWGIRDMNAKMQHCGSQSLLDAISALTLKAHVFGHIHEAYGTRKLPHPLEGIAINASQCDIWNKLVNEPVVIEI